MKEQIEDIAKVIHDSDIADINTFPISMSECLGKHGARRTGAAIAVVNAGYRKQVWISVDDRLPETYEDVLCYRGKSLYVDFICSDGTWCEDGIFTEKVTHWMPLSEPPEMKGGAE